MAQSHAILKTVRIAAGPSGLGPTTSAKDVKNARSDGEASFGVDVGAHRT